MSYVSGVTSQRIEPVISEKTRMEPAHPIKARGSFERSGDTQGNKIAFSGFDKLSEQDKESMQEELEKHNQEFSYTGKTLKFKFDEEAAMLYVEVLDSATQEVIVSLPPEFLIDLSVKMKKILGLYIDERL